jgi:lysophospholipase L1-like esterase
MINQSAAQSSIEPSSSSSMVGFRIRPTIVLFGDSLTQFGWGIDGEVGWASLLASAYSRRADVLNRGFSGYNTRHALEILPRVFGDEPQKQQDSKNLKEDDLSMLFCTVFLGANDSALVGERQHVPLNEYQRNLDQIVTSIANRGGGVCPIILMTPPPVDEPRWMAQWGNTKPDRRNDVSRNYGSACKQVAANHDRCTVLDVFEVLGGNANNYHRHLSDGLHLSGSGNILLYDALLLHIQDKYPDLAPMGGDGKTQKSGIPVEEALWSDLC